ncbi:antitoxin [Sphingomonas sp. dw_22]|uniref:antitoxin n=1 Tax=Sphingomonas sp. dw_22 TaxID=2721175 RepID=UPI001BD2DFF6|nr:antitoxin [Sphingomonas sp. dw_22]
MSRLTIDVTDQQHETLKAMAALQGKTIKEFALERLFLADGNEENACQELKVLLEHRVSRGLRGHVSNKSIGEIVEEELNKVAFDVLTTASNDRGSAQT